MRLREPGETSTADGHNYCSSCFGEDQNAEWRYIDFDAAIDRGWKYGPDGEMIAMDDLILCENCVKEAAEELGMDDAERLKELNKKLASELERSKKAEVKAQEYADRLEDTLVHHRSEPLKPDHRIKPRPARSGTGAAA